MPIEERAPLLHRVVIAQPSVQERKYGHQGNVGTLLKWALSAWVALVRLRLQLTDIHGTSSGVDGIVCQLKQLWSYSLFVCKHLI